MDTLKKQARVAGGLYLLACITAPFSLIYVPHALIVPGDATATADRLRSSETLLRMGIASELLVATLLIFALLALYRLFRGVDEKLSAAMVILLLVSIPLSLLIVVDELVALTLVSGAAFLSVFGKHQLDALAYLFLRMHSQGLYVAEIFWGLWLFPYAMLAIRSGFIPRVVAVLLMFSGLGYVISSFTSLMLPQYAHLVGRFALPLEAFEVPMLFWLLIWGVRERPVVATAS